MSKFTNVVKSGSRKVTRSVPVYVAGNLVQSAKIGVRESFRNTKESRDSYYEAKDRAKAAQEEQERMDAYFAREALINDLEADATEIICPDEVILDDEPTHISSPLATALSMLKIGH